MPPRYEHGSMFPQPPPDDAANPDVTHVEHFQLPTAVTYAWWTGVGHYGLAENWTLAPVDLPVGDHMTVGARVSYALLHDGVRTPESERLSGAVDFQNGTYIPPEGARFGDQFEVQVQVFETDVPPQHEWAPGSGRHYRVLWARALTAPFPRPTERPGMEP